MFHLPPKAPGAQGHHATGHPASGSQHHRWSNTFDTSPALPASKKKSEVVEAEVESDVLLAVVSNSHNQVRLTESTYKRCPYQDSMVSCGRHGLGMRPASRRTNEEVTLDLSETPLTSTGFSCRVRMGMQQEEDHQCSLSCDKALLPSPIHLEVSYR